MGIRKLNETQGFSSSVFSFFIYFIKKQPSAFFWALFLSLAWALDATVFPFLFGRVVDALNAAGLIEGRAKHAWSALKEPILWCFVFWILMESFFRVQGYILVRAVPKFEACIRTTLFAHIQNYSCKYFSNNFSGNIGQKISDLTLCTSRVLHAVIVTISPAILSALLAGIIMYMVHPFFCLLIEIWLFIHFVVCSILARHSSRLSAFHSKARSQLSGRLIDSLSNYLSVKVFFRQKHELDLVNAYQDEEKQRHERTLLIIERYRVALGIMTFIFPGVLINAYAYHGWESGWISVGTVVLIFNVIWNVCQTVWMCGNEMPGLFADIGMIRQGLSLMQPIPEIQDALNALPLVVEGGKITFENVSFGHGSNEPSRELLFSHLNLTILAGQRVGLVGYSGSGKSTFTNLLLRLFDVQNGRICIDGQNIAEVTQETLRRAIAYVPQSPSLFHRSVIENIRYSKLDATDKEVIAASEYAHAHPFIRTLSEGYATMVGERGVKLSGGQRQRVEIARAFLCSDTVKIIILDEATSALDSVTERDIQKSFDTLMKGKTVIVVAHRLTTLLQMDRILVFDKGKIVEDGCHFDLLAKKGLYAQLWGSQIEGFLPETKVF